MLMFVVNGLRRFQTMPSNFDLHELLRDAINLLMIGKATSHHEAISLALLRAGVMADEGDNHEQYCKVLAEHVPEIQITLNFNFGGKN